MTPPETRDAHASEPAPTAGAAPRHLSDVERAVALTLFLVLLVGCFVVLRPFLAAIVWAAILVVSTWQTYCRGVTLLGGRRSLAALVMTLGLAAVLLVPLLILGSSLQGEAVQLTATARALAETGLPPPPAWLEQFPLGGPQLDALWRSFDAEGIRVALVEYAGPIRDWVLARGADLGQGILQVALSLVTAFFLYRDAPRIVAILQEALTNVAGPRARRLALTTRNTIIAVVRGLLGTAVVQALLLAGGLVASGVPAALLLGFLAFILSLIPGALILIWLPAAGWLASQGDTQWAAFVFVWGALVGTLDNVMRPYLMGGQAGLPFLLVLLGVLGGAMSFGLVGLFLGPILLAIALALVDEWTSRATPSAP